MSFRNSLSVRVNDDCSGAERCGEALLVLENIERLVCWRTVSKSLPTRIFCNDFSEILCKAVNSFHALTALDEPDPYSVMLWPTKEHPPVIDL